MWNDSKALFHFIYIFHLWERNRGYKMLTVKFVANNGTNKLIFIDQLLHLHKNSSNKLESQISFDLSSFEAIVQFVLSIAKSSDILWKIIPNWDARWGDDNEIKEIRTNLLSQQSLKFHASSQIDGHITPSSYQLSQL